MNNPFDQAYDALWDLLMDSTELGSMVRMGNRMKLSGDRFNSEDDKERYTNKDFPELRIRPAGGNGNPFATSTSGGYEQKFDVELEVADLRIDKHLFPVKWALFKALARGDGRLGLDFVSGITMGDFEDKKNTEDIAGWTTACTITVKMYFNRASILTA